jgi:hypothetical protein
MEMRIISYRLYTISYQIWYEFFACFFLMEPGRSEGAPIASGGGMRRSEKARVSEEAVRRKGGEGGPRQLGMG